MQLNTTPVTTIGNEERLLPYLQIVNFTSTQVATTKNASTGSNWSIKLLRKNRGKTGEELKAEGK